MFPRSTFTGTQARFSNLLMRMWHFLMGSILVVSRLMTVLLMHR